MSAILSFLFKYKFWITGSVFAVTVFSFLSRLNTITTLHRTLQKPLSDSLLFAAKGVTTDVSFALKTVIPILIVLIVVVALVPKFKQFTPEAPWIFISVWKYWFLWCILFSFVGTFILLGMPAVPLLGVFDFILSIFMKLEKPYPGDTLWPMAITYTLILPWLCFACALLLTKFFPEFHGGMHVTTAILSGLLFLFFIHALFLNPNKLNENKDRRTTEEKVSVEKPLEPSMLLFSALDLLSTPSELTGKDNNSKKRVTLYAGYFRKSFADEVQNRDRFIISDKQAELAKDIDKELAALGNAPESWTEKDFETNPKWGKIRKLSWKLAMSINAKETLFKYYINYPINRLMMRFGL